MSDPEPTPSSDWPLGTWTLLAFAGAAMAAAWLFLYFGVFLPRGAIN